jgi:hypothetical protein
VPVSDDGANFTQRGRGDSDPNQENRNQHDDERQYRMHRDTHRAMVGVAIQSMRMRHVNNRQQQQ